MSLRSDVTAVILAGGMGRRMDGVDKGLVELGGQAMISYVIDTLRSQVDHVVVNANRNVEQYQSFSVAVVEDSMQGYQGPLAGLEAGLTAAQTPWVYTCPCDSPMQSPALLPHMWSEIVDTDAEIGVAFDGQRTHPVFLLVKCELLDSLRSYLQAGDRKIDRWFDRHKLKTIDCSEYASSFMNVNTEEERTNAEVQLAND